MFEALSCRTTPPGGRGGDCPPQWEYQPGSELFVVYNEDRNTSSLGVQGLSIRTIIVKVNRLFSC
jgi:hypothetical protein